MLAPSLVVLLSDVNHTRMLEKRPTRSNCYTFLHFVVAAVHKLGAHLYFDLFFLLSTQLSYKCETSILEWA